MTQPLPHGYPDYGRVVAQADKRLDRLSVPDIDAVTNYGPYFTGDAPFVDIGFVSGVGAFRIELRYYADAALTIQTNAYGMDILNGMIINLTFPVKGPYLQFRVTPAAINSSFDCDLTVMGDGMSDGGGSSRTPIVLSDLNRNVAGGGNFAATSVWLAPGPAVWNVYTFLATWEARLEALDFNGVALRLDTANNTQGNFSRLVYLPLRPIRLTVLNTTGAAGNFNYSLLSDPFWGK